eukprot:XP_001694488.1 predicted protein [Chlamydomonas reinhardtii]
MAGPGSAATASVTANTSASTRTHSGSVLSGVGVGVSGDSSSPRGILLAVHGDAAGARSPAFMRTSKRVGWADGMQQEPQPQQGQGQALLADAETLPALLPAGAGGSTAAAAARDAAAAAGVGTVSMSPQASWDAAAGSNQRALSTFPSVVRAAAAAAAAGTFEEDAAGDDSADAGGSAVNSAGLAQLLDATATAAAGGCGAGGGGFRAGRLAGTATTQLILGQGDDEDADEDAVDGGAYHDGGSFADESVTASGAVLPYHTILEGEEGQPAVEPVTGGLEAGQGPQTLAALAVVMLHGSDPATAAAPATAGGPNQPPNQPYASSADASRSGRRPAAPEARTGAAGGSDRAQAPSSAVPREAAGACAPPTFQTVQLMSGLACAAQEARPQAAGNTRLSTEPTASVLFEPPLVRSRFGAWGHQRLGSQQQEVQQQQQQQAGPGGQRSRTASVVMRGGAPDARPMPVFTFAGVIKVKGSRIPVCWVAFAGAAALEPP